MLEIPFLMNARYCATFSHEIGQTPIARRLLGLPVMIVRDKEGVVKALGHRCPHRFAPLHKGKCEDDAIECPYHGLRLALTGHCVYNPHRVSALGKLPRCRAICLHARGRADDRRLPGIYGRPGVFSLKSIYLEADFASARYRQIPEKLIAAENTSIYFCYEWMRSMQRMSS